jgi:hypothetical protein
MTRISWWVADSMSRMLADDEREAVLGDFAECGVSGGQALYDILDLIVRRQTALWKDWRPWVALIGIVGLVGALLSRMAFRFSLVLAMYFLAYWRFGVRFEDGLTVPQDIITFACQCLALIFYFWTGGFVLGSLSRHTMWVNAALFCLVLLFAGGALRDVSVVTIFKGLPLVAEVVLFVFPFIRGARRGFRLGSMGLGRTVLLAGATAAMTMFAAWTWGWRQTGLVGHVDWQARLAQLAAVTWPTGYMVAVALSARRRSRIVEG